MKISTEMMAAYNTRANEHVQFVQEAGVKIGVLPELLAIHDKSKWSPEEFDAYAQYFCSGVDKSPVDADSITDDFAVAWLHHIHHNPHHWQHWIFPDGYSPKDSSVENGVVKMPERYALEMVADWLGASKAYTGSWDITDWFSKNVGRIRVHSATAEYLRIVLGSVNMSDIIHPDVVYGCAFSGER